jgi:hypothetical protein
MFRRRRARIPVGAAMPMAGISTAVDCAGQVCFDVRL